MFACLFQHSDQQLLTHIARDQTLPVLGKYRHIPHRIVHLQTHEPAEQ